MTSSRSSPSACRKSSRAAPETAAPERPARRAGRRCQREHRSAGHSRSRRVGGQGAPALAGRAQRERPRRERSDQLPARARRGGSARQAGADDELAPTGKPTDIQAHIAAARRAAMTEMSSRRDRSAGDFQRAALADLAGPLRARAGAGARRGQARSVPDRRLVLVVAAAAAVFELRGARTPAVQKSELPATLQAPAAQLGASEAAPKSLCAGRLQPDRRDRSVQAVGSRRRARGGAAVVGAPDLARSDRRARRYAAAGPARRGRRRRRGAETELGLRYLEGRTVPRDPKLAARWLELAAAQGLRSRNTGSPRSTRRASASPRTCSSRAPGISRPPNAGNARAMHNLAVLDARRRGRRQAGLCGSCELVPPRRPSSACATASSTSASSTAAASACRRISASPGSGSRSPRSKATPTPPRSATRSRPRWIAKALAAAAKLLAEFKVQTPMAAANETPAPPAAGTPSPSASGGASRRPLRRRPRTAEAPERRFSIPVSVCIALSLPRWSVGTKISGRDGGRTSPAVDRHQRPARQHLRLRLLSRPADETVGLSKTATLIAAARTEAANVLLLDNGDFIQGTPLGDWSAEAMQAGPATSIR